ncbi:MAG: hypothetical protein ACQET8_19685 [Bacillota bacterium]
MKLFNQLLPRISNVIVWSASRKTSRVTSAEETGIDFKQKSVIIVFYHV